MSQIAPLPEELQKLAIQELGEVPARIPADLQVLKTWIRQQPHLKACTDDQFLIQFLRGCKFSIERAKYKLEQFHTLKTRYTYLAPMYDVDDPIFRKIHNTGSWLPLPTPLNGNGPRIVLLQVNFKPNEFETVDLCRYIANMCELLFLRDPYACINGFVALFDIGSGLMEHLPMLNLGILKEQIIFTEKALPLRTKAVYIVNCHPILQQIIRSIMSCMSEKLRSRLHICGSNFDALEESFPKKYLPQDFGGENGKLSEVCREFHAVFDEYREHFRRSSEYGTDERLRLGKSCQKNDTLGIGGTFRSINLD